MAFRSGDVIRGRLAYLDALKLAAKKKVSNVRPLALAYHAREEILAGTDRAEEFLQLVERAAERDGLPPGLEPFVARLREMLSAKRIAL